MNRGAVHLLLKMSETMLIQILQMAQILRVILEQQILPVDLPQQGIMGLRVVVLNSLHLTKKRHYSKK